MIEPLKDENARLRNELNLLRHERDLLKIAAKQSIPNHYDCQGLRRPIVIFDLDGTLADVTHRRHLLDEEGVDDDTRWSNFYLAYTRDTPNIKLIEIFHILKRQGVEVWIWSGRSDEVKSQTLAWLAMHDIHFDLFMMRDHKDFRPDVEIKREWLNNMLTEDRDRILCFFDDRDSVVDLWRSQGFLCCQVAPGDF
jgi:phosphoglycolate phosphatase-like HAD superfamily hydrolase